MEKINPNKNRGKKLVIKTDRWFDRECALYKQEINRSLRQYRKSDRDSNLLEKYLDSRKDFASLVRNKKKGLENRRLECSG